MLIISILILGQDVFETIKDHQQIISVAVILGLGFLLMISIHLLINSNIHLQNNRLKERLKTWTQISYRVDQVGEEAFNELPIGMIALDETNDISWVNPYVANIFKGTVLHKSLADVSDELFKLVEESKNTRNY